MLRKTTMTALVAGLVLATTTGLGAQSVSAKADQHTNLDQAIASYNAMQQYFYAGDGFRAHAHI